MTSTNMMESAGQIDESAASHLKRKRSSSITNPPPPTAPPAKAPKVAGNQLSINYLARSSNEDLPLVHKEETLPSLLQLLSLYSSVLDRHESLASNLGARPLGPILIKRFERCFDAPPKIVASHQKNASGNSEDSNHHITWLEVIEFARSHPLQFTLSTFSEGRRVCQFYYPQRQLRVQISEEDFLFIKSGRCQELIPPLPIWEDEEKEVSTCEVLEARLKELTNAADMVAARTRQLSHRLKGRKAAILERRAEGGSGTPAKVSAQQTTTAPPSAATGFVAVNTNGVKPGVNEGPGHSSSIRNELLRHFESLPQNQPHTRPTVKPVADAEGLHGFRSYETSVPEHRLGYASNPASVSPLAASPTPHDYASDSQRAQAQTVHRGSVGNAGQGSMKHNFSRPLPPALESTQPFRPLCQAHMDNLPRGQRVLPPCDRCRRLRMDCVKNLTSCAGCTKKHARCHWRDVSRDELGALDHLMDSSFVPHSPAASDGRSVGHRNQDEEAGAQHTTDEDDDDDSNALEDLEALGEQKQEERHFATSEQHETVAPDGKDSLPNYNTTRPEQGPAHVVQTNIIKASGDVQDTINTTYASAQLRASTTDSAQEHNPVAGNAIDQPVETVSERQTLGPNGNFSCGGHEHDINPKSQAGMEATASSAGGFRAVNAMATDTMGKP